MAFCPTWLLLENGTGFAPLPSPPLLLRGLAVQMMGSPDYPGHCKSVLTVSFGLVVILILRSLGSDLHTPKSVSPVMENDVTVFC
jgi:hypothetical protein